MPIKVKFLLGVMITAAVLLVLGFFVNTKGINKFGANILESINGANNSANQEGWDFRENQIIKSDIDKDGLFDEEEPLYRTDPLNPDTDGDGFLDGEEVASGYDPTIPRPDDLLLFLNENLTEKFTVLTISGLHEGSLKPDNPNFDKSIDRVVSSIITDALEDLNEDSDLKNLNLKIIDSGKTSQERYISEISKTYKDLLVNYFSELNDLQKKLEEINKFGFGSKSVKNYFSDKSTVFQNIFSKLIDLNVPKNWEANHISLLSVTKNLATANFVVASGKNDPIKTMISLNSLVLITDDLSAVTESYVKKIEEQNLNAKSTIFQK